MSASRKKGAAAFGVGIAAAGTTAAVTVVAGLVLMAGGWWWFGQGAGTQAELEPDLAFADPGEQVQAAPPTDTATPRADAAEAPRPAPGTRQGRQRSAPSPQPARTRRRPEQAAAPSPAPAASPRGPESDPAPGAPAEARQGDPSDPSDPSDDEPAVAEADVESAPPGSMRPDRVRPEDEAARGTPDPVDEELEALLAEDTPPMAPPPAPAPAAPQPLQTKPVDEGDWSLRTLVNQGIALLTGDPVPANEPGGMPETRTRPKVQQPMQPEPAPSWAGADGTHAPAPAPAARPGAPAPAPAAPSPSPSSRPSPEPSSQAAQAEPPAEGPDETDGVAAVEPAPAAGTEPAPPPEEPSPPAQPAPAPQPARAPAPQPAPAAPPRPMGTLEALVAGGMGMMTGQAIEDKAPQRTRTRSKVDEATADYVDPVDGGEMLELGVDELDPIDLEKTDPASAFATTEPEPEGWDEGPSPLDDLDVTVHIKTDTPGVPVSVDGKSVGVTPAVLDLSDDEHIVKLGPGGMGGTFAISPLGDPDSWCFTESAGKYKQALCK